jgi:hypothetical protein
MYKQKKRVRQNSRIIFVKERRQRYCKQSAILLEAAANNKLSRCCVQKADAVMLILKR